MIDIESRVFNTVSSAVKTINTNVNTSSVLLNLPSSFPFVSITEVDNYCDKGSIDSGSTEKKAIVVYEIQVFSNKKDSAKAEAKSIMKLADNKMIELGFTRNMLSQVANADASIFRMIARYQATVSFNNNTYTIYRG